MKNFFTVAVGQSTDMNFHPAPDFTCGHKHKSIAAAEHCHAKLRGYNPKTRECSAKWYNSFIVVGGCTTVSGYRTLGNFADSENK
jgi:hypothetical protein